MAHPSWDDIHPNEWPVVIDNKNDLVRLAQQMKACQVPDQLEYTAQDPNARDQIEAMNDEEKDQLRKSGANRSIIWGKGVYSLCCTLNEQDGAKWHMSMCKVVGRGQLGKMTDPEANFILDGFFSQHQEIESPSKMPAVRHFTGDD